MNTVPTRVHSVVAYAVLSRLALLAIFLVSTLVISSLPYDTSTTLTLRGSTANVASSELGIPIQNGWKASPFGKVLSRLVSWDALYFTTIAEEGYLWEHWHAFFPGFPSAMKLLATTLEGFALPLDPTDLLLLSGFIVNSVSFVVCAVILYHIALAALKHEEMAFRSVLVFCFSPANPFFFALYTESTFALTSFTGIYLTTYSSGRPVARFFRNLAASLAFAAATSIRSNGAILAAFVLYMAGVHAIAALKKRKIVVALFELVSALGCSIISCMPLVIYLHSAYERYCLGDFPREWCFDTVPNLYSFVQSHYWNVGFLNYYRVHQIPNFLLAAPIITLSFAAVWTFLRSDWANTMQLGILATVSRVESASIVASQPPTPKMSLGFFNPENLVHIAHLVALLVSALPVIHIQVLTRFLLSQCPILYCYIAHVLSSTSTPLPAKRLLLTYMVVFNVLGTVLFINFLPWT